MGVDKTTVEKALMQTINKRVRIEKSMFEIANPDYYRKELQPHIVSMLKKDWARKQKKLEDNYKEIKRLINLLKEW